MTLCHEASFFISNVCRFELRKKKTRTCLFDFCFAFSSRAKTTSTKQLFVVKSKEHFIADSASTDATAILKKDLEQGKSDATANRPISIFPWRHDDKPIPRLIPGTTEFRNDTRFGRNNQKVIAFIFLNMPTWQFLFSDQQWRNELADSCAYAFAQGVSGIISNVYSLDEKSVFRTGNDLPSDSVKIDFSYPIDTRKPNVIDDNSSGVLDSSLESNSVKESKIIPVNDDMVNGMVSAPLRKLYQSAYENGKDQFEIRLETEPRSAFLFNIIAHPFVTREAIEKNPELGELISRVDSPEGFIQFREYIMEEKARKNYIDTSVDIEVCIECNEVFQVRDRNTGEVVQGSSDGKIRKVFHFVRFERVLRSIDHDSLPFFKVLNQENWKITNIDDLLGSRPWLKY